MALEDIAGYSLRRRLGSGSAGTVWLVRDLASGRNAVLKRVPTTTIPLTEELREHLTVLQRIDHPHIARLLEIRESGTEWLLFSQYVVAGTLSGVLSRRGPLSVGELVTLLSPLAEALDYLHRSGLTHGRVSPANIMFDADGRPVLTDAVLHAHPRASTPTGTTMPASPADDFSSLAALSHEAGGDPRTFTPDLFTSTQGPQFARHLVNLADPAPINLAFPQYPTTTSPTTTDPTSTGDATTGDPFTSDTATPTTAATATASTADSTSANASTADTTTADSADNPNADSTTASAAVRPPRPRATATPPTDEPQQRSRGPLSHSQPEPSTPDSPEPTAPQPALAKPTPRSANPKRRNRSVRAKLTRRTTSPPTHPNPLARLTPTRPTYAPPTASSGSAGAVATSSSALPATSAALPAASSAPPAERSAAPAASSARPAASFGRPAAFAGLAAPDDALAVGETAQSTASSIVPTGTVVLARSTPADPAGTGWVGAGNSGFGPATLGSARGGPSRTRRRAWRRRSAFWRRFRRPVRVAVSQVSRSRPDGPDREPASKRRLLSHPAYGVLAAAGAAAVIVLILGLVTIGALDNPTGRAAAADRANSTLQPSTTPTPTPPPPPPPPPTPSASAHAQSPAAGADAAKWVRTLEALDVRRAQAFWALDAGILDEIYVPGSGSWSADRAMLMAYRKQQVRVRGLRIQIDTTTVERRTASSVTLRTVDHLVGGELVDRNGTKTPLPPGTPTTRLITLTTTPANPTWRITTITSA